MPQRRFPNWFSHKQRERRGFLHYKVQPPQCVQWYDLLNIHCAMGRTEKAADVFPPKSFDPSGQFYTTPPSLHPSPSPLPPFPSFLPPVFPPLDCDSDGNLSITFPQMRDGPRMSGWQMLSSIPLLCKKNTYILACEETSSFTFRFPYFVQKSCVKFYMNFVDTLHYSILFVRMARVNFQYSSSRDI